MIGRTFWSLSTDENCSDNGWPRFPRALRLHHARLGVPDVETIDDVRVTTPLRTLIDMIVDGAIAPELQVQTLAQAIAVG